MLGHGNTQHNGRVVEPDAADRNRLGLAWCGPERRAVAVSASEVVCSGRERDTNVLVITIEQRDATVVQVTLSPKNFALLLKDPEGTGKALTEEATIIDQE